MIIKSTDFHKFIDETKNKTVVAFGATVFMQVIADNYEELCLGERVDYIVDNDLDKDGTSYVLNGKNKAVHSLSYLLQDDLSNKVILIGSDAYALEMYDQLESIETLRDVPCFCLAMMIADRVDDTIQSMNIRSDGIVVERTIPKIIHCFWFSGDEKDELSKKCMESWRKYCPEYEIKEWNSENYDVTKNSYMLDAYKLRKWAYVTDYARLDMIYQFGGFYFDMDLELLKNIDDLLTAEFITGFGPIRDVELAAFGASKGSELVKQMLDSYIDRRFGDKTLTLRDVQPVHMDAFMRKQGFLINGKYQNRNNTVLLPRDAFSPRNWFTGEIENTDNSYGIHHCAGGWNSKEERQNKKLTMKKLSEIFTL